MKKTIKSLMIISSIILLLSVFIFAPFDVSAQNVISGNVSSCKPIYSTLYFGTRGSDVSSLQQFLKDRGFLDANVTGYFGFSTFRGLVRWQISAGISGVGRVGPQTRLAINNICTGGGVYNFTPSDICQSWYDGCNNCSRQTPGGPSVCTMRACFAQNFSQGQGYCISNFNNSTTDLPPVISGFSGPTTLPINQTGTWTVNARDPENQNLSYNILWGDEVYYPTASSASLSLMNSYQTTTFTHSYSNSGTYTVTISVSDPAGHTARTTSTVIVNSNNTTICTMEYNPVCAQPPEPACRYSNPACMIATPGPRTYSNICTMNADHATYLYNGSCNNGN